jgi:hypothetical protein
LRDVVGRPRNPPPPLQVGGFIQTCGWVSATDSLQELGRNFQVVDSNPVLFTQCSHFLKLNGEDGRT